MRTLTLASLLVASLSVSAPTQAQYNPAAQLTQALQVFAQQARRIRSAPIRQAVARFQRTMRNQPGNLVVVAQRYGDLRLQLHTASIGDAQILDAWDMVVHTYLVYAESGIQNPVVHQPPHQPPVVVAPPGHHAGAYTFQGSFENTPVTFSGNSPDDVYHRCSQFMAAARITQVDDIRVNGRAYRNQPSYWQNDALCSIAALNSSPAPQIVGDAEGTPFAVGAGEQRVLQVYLPRALTSLQVDDIVVNGQSYHNQYGYWGAHEVVQMVVSQSQGRRGQRRRRGRR